MLRDSAEVSGPAQLVHPDSSEPAAKATTPVHAFRVPILSIMPEYPVGQAPRSLILASESEQELGDGAV